MPTVFPDMEEDILERKIKYDSIKRKIMRWVGLVSVSSLLLLSREFKRTITSIKPVLSDLEIALIEPEVLSLANDTDLLLNTISDNRPWDWGKYERAIRVESELSKMSSYSPTDKDIVELSLLVIDNLSGTKTVSFNGDSFLEPQNLLKKVPFGAPSIGESHNLYALVEGLTKNVGSLNSSVLEVYQKRKESQEIFDSLFSDAKQKRYDSIHQKVASLVKFLEQDRAESSKKLLQNVKSFSYNCLEYVPETYIEKKLGRVSESEVSDVAARKTIGVAAGLVFDALSLPFRLFSEEKSGEGLLDCTKAIATGKKMERVPEHYRKVRVTPYSGRREVIDDHISMRNKDSVWL